MSEETIFTHVCPWTVYGLNWSKRPNTFRLGLSSFSENYNNKLSAIQIFPQQSKFIQIAEADHNFPITKLQWAPFTGRAPDLMATTGDHLRIWELVSPDEHTSNQLDSETGLVSSNYELLQRVVLTARKTGQSKSESTPPMTSFDWNENDPNKLVTSSIDTTCTIWDLQQQIPKTTLIAHDKEVFDVAFGQGTDIFASVGADGSVRLFDLRSLEHSTIIYDSPSKSPISTSLETSPLLRLAWNKKDSNYIATFQADCNHVLILDIRQPLTPVAELIGHSGPLNAIGWAPHSSGHLGSVSDDGQALIWDVSQMTRMKNIHEPILAYDASSQINQFSWCTNNPEWVAIAFGNKVQALRV